MTVTRRCRDCKTPIRPPAWGWLCRDCRFAIQSRASRNRSKDGLTPPWVEARIALYRERASLGEPLFREETES